MYRALPTLTMHNKATVGHHAVLMRSSWARYGYRHDAAEGAEQLTGQIPGVRSPTGGWSEYLSYGAILPA